MYIQDGKYLAYCIRARLLNLSFRGMPGSVASKNLKTKPTETLVCHGKHERKTSALIKLRLEFQGGSVCIFMGQLLPRPQASLLII